MIPRHSRPSAALAVRTTRRTHLLRSSRGCTRSRGAFDAFACSRGGSGSQVAVSRQDCPLVVPAEVALDRLYVLTLHGAGQGVRTARTEELAASAHLQLSLDRAGVHRHLLQTAAAAPALSPASWLPTGPHALHHPHSITFGPADIVFPFYRPIVVPASRPRKGKEPPLRPHNSL
jgi:hypothetical protein